MGKLAKNDTLADPNRLNERIALLGSPNIIALEEWRKSVMRPGMRIPHFDPLDGGVKAQMLLLMETPAPGSTPLRFVSRDNASGTAANLRRFLSGAGFTREQVILWNAVPWIIHAPNARNRSPKRDEIVAGLQLLPGLLEILPSLKVAVLAGKPAAQAEPIIKAVRPEITVLQMPHPSPVYVNTKPDIAPNILSTLRSAQSLIAHAD